MPDIPVPTQTGPQSRATGTSLSRAEPGNRGAPHGETALLSPAAGGRVGANCGHARTGLEVIVRPSATGLRFSSRTPFEIWRAIGPRIAVRASASRWWLGDWLVFGERRYGTRYRDAIAATGLDYQTLRNYAVVARRFELSRRRDNLSFQHHAEVCALPERQQERWLDLASHHQWSRQELRLRIRRMKRMEEGNSQSRALRFIVDDEHEERWRQAAARCHCAFDDWVIRSLDAAAEA